METGKIIAVVQSIGFGKHGRYVITTSEKIEGSITFSLEKENKVWEEEEDPEPGTYVVLESLRKKVDGWRAHKARFLKHTNNKPTSKGEKTL